MRAAQIQIDCPRGRARQGPAQLPRVDVIAAKTGWPQGKPRTSTAGIRVHFCSKPASMMSGAIKTGSASEEKRFFNKLRSGFFFVAKAIPRATNSRLPKIRKAMIFKAKSSKIRIFGRKSHALSQRIFFGCDCVIATKKILKKAMNPRGNETCPPRIGAPWRSTVDP